MRRLLAALVTALLVWAAGWTVRTAATAGVRMSTPEQRPLDEMLREAWAYRHRAWLIGDVAGIFTWRDAFDRLLDRMIDEREVAEQP